MNITEQTVISENGVFSLEGGYFSSTNVAISGAFTWSSGSMDSATPSATLTINSGGSLTITGAAYPIFSGTIQNNGTVNWHSVNPFASFSSTEFNNNGSLVLYNDLILNNDSGAGTFRNFGEILAPSNSTVKIENKWTFINKGTVSAESNAVLSLESDYYHTPYTFEEGSVIAGAGVVRAANGGSIIGSGTITVSGTFKLDQNGSIGGTHTWTGPGLFDWAAGGGNGDLSVNTFAPDFHARFSDTYAKYLNQLTIRNEGTVTWEAEFGSLVGGFFENAGLFVIKTNSYFFSSGTFHNTTAGIFRNEADSVSFDWDYFINDGTVDLKNGALTASPISSFTSGTASAYRFELRGYNPGADFGSWNGNNIELNGGLSVTLTNGFIPASGSSFTLFNYSSAINTFTSTNLPALPSNMVWRVDYNLNDITLRVLQAPFITSGPTNQIVAQGGSATFNVTAIGEEPLTYQWKFNNTILAGATDASFTDTNVQLADLGTYTIVVSNEFGTATNSATLNFGDTNHPTITVTSPKGNLTTNVAALTVTGTAKDDLRVEQVLYQINGGSFQPVTLASNAQNVNWSFPLTLSPGTNLLRVKSVDLAGLEPLVFAARTIFYVSNSILTVNITGDGTTVGNTNLYGTPTNTASLQIGRGYKITALAASNSVFTNWTGSIAITNAILNFVMQSNMVLTANFITNPFIAVAGIYNGLFFEPNGVFHESSGLFSLT